MIFQHFQDAANGFARASDNLTDFLAGNFNLHTVRVGHRIRLFCQVQQRLGDTTSHVEESEVAHFFRRNLQTARHLRRETHQDIRVNLDQLTEFFVGDFGHFTCGFRTYPGATLLTFFKQA